MKRPGSGHRQEQNAPITAWVPVLAAVAIMVTGCVSTLVALELDAFRPTVGDVVVFKPGSQDSDAWQLNVPATDVAGPDVTNPNVTNPDVTNPQVTNPQVTNPQVTSPGVAGAPTASCTLNPNVMAVGGGSLVVEARRETDPPLYRLHWAGGHTDNGQADCGTAAELTVTRVDLQKLANAAGGFGIGNRDIGR